MLDWQADVIDRGLEGTDEEIFALLSADKRTVEQLPALEFRRKLREWNILKQSAETKLWIGPLMDLYKSEMATPELKNGIDDLVSTFEEGTDTIAIEREPYATQFYSLAGVLLMTKMISPEQLQEVYNLAGGLKYGGVTLEDVQAAHTAHDVRARMIAGKEKYDELEADTHIRFNQARNRALNVISDGPEAVELEWKDAFKV